MARMKAAQYLRVSTEHQKYSLESQAERIRSYAEEHEFEIVATYADRGKSGLRLENRPSLGRLLAEVICGTPEYNAILVYDVSRWGRFPDSDEAAHYEFLCRTAGVPIYYCAEDFANDDTIASNLLKIMKRSMAAEYSRELSARVYAGQKRVATLGFHVGGSAPYGFTRVVIASDGSRRTLALREHKAMQSERVILTPSRDTKEHFARQIYRWALHGLGNVAIARRLNALSAPTAGSGRWNSEHVRRILRNPTYAGIACWGRTRVLPTRHIRVPREEWIMVAEAIGAIVTRAEFDKVQRMLDKRLRRYTNAELLQGLRKLLKCHGRLSKSLIDNAPDIASAALYVKRFGTVGKAYGLIGYCQTKNRIACSIRRTLPV